jgi:hypothetical protein
MDLPHLMMTKIKNMKQIAHTINRDGKIVPANGFKQPTPTIAMQNPSGIWMHSIERKDFSNPLTSFLVFGIAILLIVLILVFVR